jgi:DNA-binding response OmpR family regulator
MKKIILVDDDPMTHHLVQQCLPDDGRLFSFYDVKSGLAALIADSDWALAIIDRILPDGDGLTICAKIRSEKALDRIPILFLSAQDSESDKVAGLFAGADDYVAKPFGLLELKARIMARLRVTAKSLRLGPLAVELDNYRAYVESPPAAPQDLDLTKLEFKMLVMFLKNPDRVHDRHSLLDSVWGKDHHITDRVVDTHVSHLRKKLKAAGLELESLRGEGYRLVYKKAS